MNGSQVCLLLYSVVLMEAAAHDIGEASPAATMGPSGTTGLSKADKSINQISTKVFKSTMPAIPYTSATSGTNAKPSGQPPTEAQPTPCTGSIHNCLLWLFEKEEGTTLLMVTGFLIFLCTALLVSTVVLLCHVFLLKCKPRSSTISSCPTCSNVDLVSQRTNQRPGCEPNETSLMMADVRQTQEEEPKKEDKDQGEDETAKDTPGKEEEAAAKAIGTPGSAENGPSQESPATTTTKQSAEPFDPAATTASPSSQAFSDVVVG